MADNGDYVPPANDVPGAASPLWNLATILIIGMTGAGKTSLANYIAGVEHLFGKPGNDHVSDTRRTAAKKTSFLGDDYYLMCDTPGLGEGAKDSQHMRAAIAAYKLVNNFRVLVIVVNGARGFKITQEVKNALKVYRDVFASSGIRVSELARRTVVVFTNFMFGARDHEQRVAEKARLAKAVHAEIFPECQDAVDHLFYLTQLDGEGLVADQETPTKEELARLKQVIDAKKGLSLRDIDIDTPVSLEDHEARKECIFRNYETNLRACIANEEQKRGVNNPYPFMMVVPFPKGLCSFPSHMERGFLRELKRIYHKVVGQQKKWYEEEFWGRLYFGTNHVKGWLHRCKECGTDIPDEKGHDGSWWTAKLRAHAKVCPQNPYPRWSDTPSPDRKAPIAGSGPGSSFEVKEHRAGRYLLKLAGMAARTFLVDIPAPAADIKSFPG
mmetsp:Transcript_26511/g.74094  ORF Transcript_26511/g.74094 Transcript_26511/m.74094 type:complete len:441 (+) Transcript_26511:260-1582(+)